MAKELAKIQQNVLERVHSLSSNGEVFFPKNYSPENAIKQAFLILNETEGKGGQPALEICSQTSIYNALLDMVIQGLSPSKNQGYFIVRGNKLCFDRSYFGTVAMLMRLDEVLDINPQIIYDGDDVTYEIEEARITNVKHAQTFEAKEKGIIKAVYATIVYKDKDGKVKQVTEIMTMEEVNKSWEKSRSRQRTVHKEFPAEMAKRTVLNRLGKMFINTSNDANLETIALSYMRTDGRQEVDDKDDDANAGGIIDVDPDEIEDADES